MGNIQIVWGPLSDNLISSQPYYSVRDLFNANGHLDLKSIIDDDSKKELFLIAHEDYGSIKEFIYEYLPKIITHLIQREVIDKCIIQNPPRLLLKSIRRNFRKIDYVNYEYQEIDGDTFIKIADTLSENILGQKSAIDELLSALYIRKVNITTKPLVILLYGQEGVGKTETAKIISQQIYQHEMFRKQLSMFQTQDFGDYMFGSSGNQSSFARDLLIRKSNVILLDEFDKCPSTFYSAFYQLFDEGVYADKNYDVSLNDTIIICTSNYRSEEEVKAFLGGPIYSRFDAVIGYSSLSKEVKERIIKASYEKNLAQFPDEDQQIIASEHLLEQLISKAELFQNVREIDKTIKLLIANRSMKNFLHENQVMDINDPELV